MERLQEIYKKFQTHTAYASFEKAIVLFVLIGFPLLLLFPIFGIFGQYKAQALISTTASPFELLTKTLGASWGYLIVLALVVVLWFFVRQRQQERIEEFFKEYQVHTTYAKLEKVVVLFVLIGFPFLLLFPIFRILGQYKAQALISTTASPFELLTRALGSSLGYLFVLALMIFLWFRVGRQCGFEYARMHFRKVSLKGRKGFNQIILFLYPVGLTFSFKGLIFDTTKALTVSGDLVTVSLIALAYSVLLIVSALVGYFAKKEQKKLNQLDYRSAEIYDWITWMYKITEIGKRFNEDGKDHHDIRCTVFMCYKSSHSRLIQACDYYPPYSLPTFRFGVEENRKTGHGKANRTYRIMDDNQPLGVLGAFVGSYLAAQTKDLSPEKDYTTYLAADSTKDRASFIKQTMKRFHYSGFFARQLSDNRKSYYCLAIITQAEELLGVLYFDSCEERSFTTKSWEAVEKKILHYLPYLGRILTQHEPGVNHDYG